MVAVMPGEAVVASVVPRKEQVVLLAAVVPAGPVVAVAQVKRGHVEQNEKILLKLIKL